MGVISEKRFHSTLHSASSIEVQLVLQSKGTMAFIVALVAPTTFLIKYGDPPLGWPRYAQPVDCKFSPILTIHVIFQWLGDLLEKARLRPPQPTCGVRTVRQASWKGGTNVVRKCDGE
jgi:hypothetical protein